jgi:hypothetical protein
MTEPPSPTADSAMRGSQAVSHRILIPALPDSNPWRPGASDRKNLKFSAKSARGDLELPEAQMVDNVV